MKETKQIPLAESADGAQTAAASPDIVRAISAVVVDYRDRLVDVIDRAAPPHDLPSAQEALATIGFGHTTGPKKPVLVRAFKPAKVSALDIPCGLYALGWFALSFGALRAP